MKLYKNKDTKRWREERKEWMTGLKTKNGALQRDKLKMGIGKNERMMESQRDGEWWSANVKLWEMWRDGEWERQGWHKNEWRREAGEKVWGCCCIAASLLMQHVPLHAQFFPCFFFLLHLILSSSLTHSGHNLTFSHFVGYALARLNGEEFTAEFFVK